MKHFLIIGLLLISQLGFSQIKEINPTSTRLLDLSTSGEKEFNDNLKTYEKIKDKMSNGVEFDDLSQQEKDAYSKVDETMEDYWDIIGNGCSWYCGGGAKEVTASSYLKSQGANSYVPQNAHDLNYKNVWAEGVDGYGIGEYLLYTFEATSPRINEIIIVNGHVKSKTAWENNSRVKKLKVYIDNKPYATLNLKDIRGSQCFKVDPIGNGDRENWDALKTKPDWTLKFEILDVYKGLKYDDVVVSEIYFDGLDVHCFAKGTKVMLADKSTKNIEDLQIGDKVACLDFETKSIISAKIEKLEKVIHHGLVTYQFKSGLEITATQDHPFRIKDKGWASLKPDKSNQYKGFEKIQKIAIGDSFISTNGSEKLMAINYLEGKQETYTISKLSWGDNFIANGLIAGVEEMK
ncbi:MAG: Hint domain-containing homing endonuclease [Dysgonamonadaceae bacterium]|nr:Hint domain-containing homing endonuclease [Dysgonamonadaceae bacterium]MDD4727148.1 Hint domain-containing homing endonuclease [Dysgonamonadaceae bacterium]